MFPFLFWLSAAPNCSQWKKLSLWKRGWPASCRAMAAARPLPVGLAELLPSWPSGSGASRGASGGLHGEQLAESVRRSANPPERRRQPFPRPLLNSAPSSPRLLWLRRALLFACSAEDIAMRTGSLFRGERRHEAGERAARTPVARSWRLPLVLAAGRSLLPSWRQSRVLLQRAHRASPASRRAPPPLPPRPALPASPRSPSGHPALFPSLWGPPPLGERRCGGWLLEEQPLQCSNEVALPPSPATLGRITVGQASVLAEPS